MVYLIEWKRCSIQYVGKTDNALRICMTRYQLDINHQHMEVQACKHLNMLDHSIEDLSIMVIEKIHGEDAAYPKRKESHWIEML